MCAMTAGVATLDTLSLALDLACLAVLVSGALAYLASLAIVGSFDVRMAPETPREPVRIGLPVHLIAAYCATMDAREESTAIFPLVTLKPYRANVSRDHDRNVIPQTSIRADCYRIADGMARALGPRWLTD